MDLFKLVGSIVINGAEKAKSDIASVGNAASGAANTISKSNQNINNSNKTTNSSWATMKSAVDQYKAQGLSTSAAWRKATQDMKGSTESAGTGMSNSFAKVGAAIGTFMGGAVIVGFGQSCVQAAADAQAMESQFSQVFGDLEGKASKSLGKIADSAGINENRMKGSFTKIAAFAKTTGMDTEGSLKLSERAMVAVADSAAFYDRSLEETTESLQSFLKGNYENDSALGLSCTEVTRNEAANKLYGKSFKDLSEAQKQLTLLQMVEDANKASGALGQAARESDTWTNVTGNLKQSWKDLQAVLGVEILPKVTGFVKGLTEGVQGLIEKTKDAVQWAKDHEQTLLLVGIAFGTIGAAIAGYNIAINASTIALKAHQLATKVATLATTAFGSVMAFLTSPVTLVILAIGALVAAVVVMYNKFDWFKEIVDKVGATIKSKLAAAIEFVKPYIADIGKALKEFGAAVKDAIGKVIDTFKNLVAKIREVYNSSSPTVKAFKQMFETAFNNIKTVISTVFSVIKTVISTALTVIKQIIKVATSVIKGDWKGAWEGIKSIFSTIWNGIKTVVKTVLNGIKTVISSSLKTIKSTASNILNGVKTAFSNAWNSIKSSVKNAISGVKSSISSGLSGAKSTVSEKLNSIKEKFSSIWSSVKSTVSGAISKVKGMMKFSWSLPKLKLPHFSVSGGKAPWGFMGKGSLPKVSIDWYAKAMDNAMILKKPTIFGYSAKSGKFLGGGEAGSEVVAGSNTLMGMISAAVANQNEAVVYYLQKIIEVLADFFPQIIDGLDRPLCFDPNTAAAAMAVPMDRELGKLSVRKKRGR